MKAIVPFVILVLGWAVFKGEPQAAVFEQVPLRWDEHIQKAYENLEEAGEYLDIEKVQLFQEIPFCLILGAEDSESEEAVEQSLYSQGYQNYNIVRSMQSGFNYRQLSNLVEAKCGEDSVLVFVSQRLQPGSMKALNQYYQKFNTWMTYGPLSSGNGFEIVSLYSRIFKLVGTNAFSESNSLLLETGNPNVLVAAVFELCRYHNKKVELGALFENSEMKGAS